MKSLSLSTWDVGMCLGCSVHFSMRWPSFVARRWFVVASLCCGGGETSARGRGGGTVISSPIGLASKEEIGFARTALGDGRGVGEQEDPCVRGLLVRSPVAGRILGLGSWTGKGVASNGLACSLVCLLHS